MPREFFKAPQTQWEPIGGHHPTAMLDSHPARELVALQVSGAGRERAGVWSSLTGKVVWEPENTVALCWAADGREVFLLREQYLRSHEHPSMIVTDLQSEYSHCVERLAWPEIRVLASCPVELPSGWPTEIQVARVGKVGLVAWQEQDCAGIQVFGWGEGELIQRNDLGYRGLSPYMDSPALSPDGRHVVLTYGASAWWSGDPNESSPGGVFRVGEVVVGDLDKPLYSAIDVSTSLRKGWRPADPDDGQSEMISTAVFLDHDRFQVVLPTGEVHVYSASRAARK